MRKSLQKLAVCSSILLTSCTLHPEKHYFYQDTPANAFLVNFPEKLPSASRIEKYCFENARYCMIHIRDKHYIPGLKGEELKPVEKTQRRIYAILFILAEKNKFSEVYQEGIVQETEKLFNETSKIERDLNKLWGDGIEAKVQSEVKELEALLNNNSLLEVVWQNEEDRAKYKEKLKKEIESVKEKLPQARETDSKYKKGLRNRRSMFGASWVLAVEGKYVLRAAETTESNLKADLEFRRGIIGNALMDGREDALVNIIAKNQNSQAPVIYGGLHYFLDNIKRWNKKHDDKKFSLISITPEDYDD